MKKLIGVFLVFLVMSCVEDMNLRGEYTVVEIHLEDGYCKYGLLEDMSKLNPSGWVPLYVDAPCDLRYVGETLKLTNIKIDKIH